MWSVPRCYKQGQFAVGVGWCELDNLWVSAVVSCCCEKLVAEAGDSSGTQRKGNVRRCSRYQATASEDVTVDTSVCITVNCNV
jgi:hypothetical protein